MGLAGFSITSAKLSLVLVSHISFFVALFFFLAFFIAYAYKCSVFFTAVQDEFANPITINFFPAFPMATLLLSLPMQHFSMLASAVLWWMAAGIQLILAIIIFYKWTHNSNFQTNHITPVWFLPLVGNLLIPITGKLHANAELLWFFYSFGTFFWLIIFTLFLNRIFFHEPLPNRLSPTFAILLAPPSLVVLSSLALQEDGSSVRMAYYIGLFILFLLLSQAKKIVPKEFFISWWAFSFPLAAFTSASVAMHTHFSGIIFWWIGVFCYALLSVIIIFLLYKTAQAMMNGEICKGH